MDNNKDNQESIKTGNGTISSFNKSYSDLAEIHSPNFVNQSTPKHTKRNADKDNSLVPSNQSADVLISPANSTGSSICRICHDGVHQNEAGGELIKPCHCMGTMGAMHRVCIERWLGLSNSTHCEICNYSYRVQRKPKPFREWIFSSIRAHDRRNLLADIACLCLLTPLAAVSGWLCLTGASHYFDSETGRWEVAGLISLSVFLVVIYLVWCVVALRYHRRIYKEWQEKNQDVKVLDCNDSLTPVTLASSPIDHSLNTVNSPTFSLLHNSSSPPNRTLQTPACIAASSPSATAVSTMLTVDASSGLFKNKRQNKSCSRQIFPSSFESRVTIQTSPVGASVFTTANERVSQIPPQSRVNSHSKPLTSCLAVSSSISHIPYQPGSSQHSLSDTALLLQTDEAYPLFRETTV